MKKANSIHHVKKLINFVKKETVFSISFLLAATTSFISIPKFEYIDFKVIFSLLNLMILVKAFEKLKIMDMAAIKILDKFRSSRMVSLILILITFFSSMLVTNDVALLTFVPLTLVIGKMTGFNCMETIIFQTLAANIGSSLTPMGNPQNLFLFTHYDINVTQFFMVVSPFVFMGMLWLLLLNMRIPASDLAFSLGNIKVNDKKKAAVYCILFLAVILSIFKIMDYKTVSALTIVVTLIMDSDLLKRVDYFLILTFVCFFIFIGNISNIPAICSHIRAFLSSSERTYFTSIVLSQFISNVPSAILLSGFTANWREVLLGVNIGGMGTLIASLASVISYKLYCDEQDHNSKYIAKFTIYNFGSLILFSILNFLIYMI